MALQETERRIARCSTLIGTSWPQDRRQVSPGHGKTVCAQSRVTSVDLRGGLRRFYSPYFCWQVTGSRKWGHRKWWDLERKGILGEREAEWTGRMGHVQQPFSDPLYWFWNIYSSQMLKHYVYTWNWYDIQVNYTSKKFFLICTPHGAQEPSLLPP